LPQIGPETSWQNENVENSTPTTNGFAPKCVTKYGSSGMSMLNPKISINVMPRIGARRRITGALFEPREYRASAVRRRAVSPRQFCR